MRKECLLDGNWDFAFSAEPQENFGQLSYDTVLPVPSCFDVMVPFYGKRGYGCYRRKVNCGGLVKLSIDGVGFEAKVYWDGQLVGTMPYAYMPEDFTFDSGVRGEHELLIVTCNLYNNVFRPFYDFYGYGGIYGSVQLTELPENHIQEVRISTEDYRTGLIRLRIHASTPYSGKIKLVFDNGHAQECMMRNGDIDECMQVPDFHLWSPEHPALHRLHVYLEEDEWHGDFGIRECRADGSRLLLNGKELRLIGYNRHESHPAFGAAVPPALMAADLQMIRAQGCNFIRGSHYPQRRSFLSLCDKLGMLVWEETLGWGIHPPALMEEDFLKQQLDQAHRLTRRSFNHPCVIIRGFLNETSSHLQEARPIIKALCDAIRLEDEHCLITLASNKYELDSCLDLVDIVAMNPYPGWYDCSWEETSDIAKIRPCLTKLRDAMPRDKPFMISEIGGAALYGYHDGYSLRWSEEYQAQLIREVAQLFLEDKRFCGLAFWQFCDCKSYVNGHVIGRPRGFNNKGLCDEYRRPKAAFHTLSSLLQASNGIK